MDEMAIGEVARRAGLNTSALRYYERIGLLPRSRRVNGYRRYDAGILRRLALIQFAQQAGFTLAEIQVLLDGFKPETAPGERWHALAHDKLREIDAMIERAQMMKQMLETTLHCGCADLDECGAMLASG